MTVFGIKNSKNLIYRVLLHLLENTFNPKRISANPSLNPNSNPNHNVFQLTK